MSDLIERLRHADIHSQQRVLGSRIFGEAADRIEALQELVAAAEEAEWLTKDIFWSIWGDYRLLGGTIKVDTPDIATNWKATAAALETENAELRQLADDRLNDAVRLTNEKTDYWLRIYELEKALRSLIDHIANSDDEQMTPTMRQLVSAGRTALRDAG